MSRLFINAISIPSVVAVHLVVKEELFENGQEFDQIYDEDLSKAEAPSIDTLRVEENTRSHRIPNNLIFTYAFDLRDPPAGKQLSARQEMAKKNVEQIIASNTQESDPLSKTEIFFYSDDQCVDLLKEKLNMPELAHYFQLETDGAFKGDICRLGALKFHGGYYFDVDLGPRYSLKDIADEIDQQNNIGFVTAQGYDWKNLDESVFFQAFIGTMKDHPLIDLSIKKTVDFYQNHRRYRLCNIDDPDSKIRDRQEYWPKSDFWKTIRINIHNQSILEPSSNFNHWKSGVEHVCGPLVNGDNSISQSEMEQKSADAIATDGAVALVGCLTMAQAYRELRNDPRIHGGDVYGTVKFLTEMIYDESNFQSEKYELLAAAPSTEGGCFFVVTDPTSKKIFFYSRIYYFEQPITCEHGDLFGGEV